MTFGREMIEHLTEVALTAAVILLLAFLIVGAIMTAGNNGEPTVDPNDAPILRMVK